MNERKLQWVLALLCFLLFAFAKSHQVIDSNFNLLLSHNIYTHGNLNIRPYLDNPKWQEVANFQLKHGVFRAYDFGAGEGREEWRIFYPIAPAVLSVPLVFIIEKLGFAIGLDSPPDWNNENENRFQKLIASLLMAIYSVLLFRVARLWLTQNQSMFILLPLVFGSSILSTLSRGAWSDTWSVMFIMFAIHHLAHVQMQKTLINTMFLALLLSLAFFCKPVYALSVLSCLAWSWQLSHKKTLRLCGFGSVFALAFLLWTQYSGVGGFTSNYLFSAFEAFDADYLWGQLISPSRGLLVFWTWTIPLIVLFAMVWQKMTTDEKKLSLIASFPMVAIVGLVSFYPEWHGGMAYGPRINVSGLPWLSLIAIISISVWWREKTNNKSKGLLKGLLYKPIVLALASIFLVLSVLINFYGAIQPKTFYAWHVQLSKEHPPIKSILDKSYQKKFWNWRDPIFLAGIIKPERYFNISIEKRNDK